MVRGIKILPFERAAPRGELGREGRHGRAGGVARAGLERHGLDGVEQHLLERGGDGANARVYSSSIGRWTSSRASWSVVSRR